MNASQLADRSSVESSLDMSLCKGGLESGMPDLNMKTSLKSIISITKTLRRKKTEKRKENRERKS